MDSFCKVQDNNTVITGLWSDCNNDGQYDYFKEYTNNKLEQNFLYTCKYDTADNYTLESGCILSRLNSSIPWVECDLNDDVGFCNIQRSTLIEVTE